MKAKIHPTYHVTTVSCGCGNKFVTRSTVEEMKVEICFSCHPFYTGRQKFVDTAGRVEKFTRKYGWTDSDKTEDVKLELKSSTKAAPKTKAEAKADKSLGDLGGKADDKKAKKAPAKKAAAKKAPAKKKAAKKA
ncbi:MAG: 50S ribosomal protein L31 [Planctomycetota bacterium]|jgi:large subunit ribosomal protein L31